MYTTSSVMPGTTGDSHRGRPIGAQSTGAVCDNVATVLAAAERAGLVASLLRDPGPVAVYSAAMAHDRR